MSIYAKSVLQLTLRKVQELCYIVFRDFIAEYTGNQIVMSELYDSPIPKCYFINQQHNHYQSFP